MAYTSNVPDVPLRCPLIVPIPPSLHGDYPKCIAYNEKVCDAYFRTSIACCAYNLYYFKTITIEEWEGKTQRLLWQFALEHEWEFIE